MRLRRIYTAVMGRLTGCDNRIKYSFESTLELGEMRLPNLGNLTDVPHLAG